MVSHESLHTSKVTEFLLFNIDTRVQPVKIGVKEKPSYQVSMYCTKLWSIKADEKQGMVGVLLLKQTEQVRINFIFT